MTGELVENLTFGERSPDITELVKALIAFKRECPKVKAGRWNDISKSKYANLSDIDEVVAPILLKHGLIYTQLLSADQFDATCKTVLIHESGQFISASLTMTAHERQGTQAPSAKPGHVAAALGHAKANGLKGILALAFDDEKSEPREKEKAKAKQTPPPPPSPPAKPDQSQLYDHKTKGHLETLSAWYQKHNIDNRLYQEIEMRLRGKPWSELGAIAREVAKNPSF